MAISNEEWSQLREDVGYIKAKIEVVSDHETRIRAIEKKWWQFPVTIVATVIAQLFRSHHGM